MTKEQLFSYVDHTQLKAFATWADIQKLCDEAVEYKTASVCVPPCYIKRIADTTTNIPNCANIGKPSIVAKKAINAPPANHIV